MHAKSKKRKLRNRNPLAKAVGKLQPKVVPDRRRKKLAALKKREADEEMEK